MLAARGISEALVANPDQSLIRDSLLSALDSAKNRYSCSSDQLYKLMESLVDLANTKSAHLRLPLLSATQKSQSIDDSGKAKFLEQVENYSAGWDDTSRLCISAMIADPIINNAMRGARVAISHFTDLQRKLN